MFKTVLFSKSKSLTLYRTCKLGAPTGNSLGEKPCSTKTCCRECKHHTQAILYHFVLGLLYDGLQVVGLFVHLDLQLVGLVPQSLQLVPYPTLLQIQVQPLTCCQLVDFIPTDEKSLMQDVQVPSSAVMTLRMAPNNKYASCTLSNKMHIGSASGIMLG